MRHDRTKPQAMMRSPRVWEKIMRKRNSVGAEALKVPTNSGRQRLGPTRNALLGVSQRKQVKLPVRRPKRPRKDQRPENPNQSPRAQRVNRPDNAVAAQIVAGPAARPARAETSKASKNSRANSVKRGGRRRRHADH